VLLLWPRGLSGLLVWVEEEGILVNGRGQCNVNARDLGYAWENIQAFWNALLSRGCLCVFEPATASLHGHSESW